MNTVYFHRKEIQKYLLEKCALKTVGHYQLLKRVENDRWMKKVSLCELSQIFGISLVDILLNSKLEQYLNIEAKYRYIK